MNQEKIGKFIAELRKEKKLTQEELAYKLGITKNAVSKWERGISLMDMSLLQPLCKILDISVTELLNGERIDDEHIQSKSEEVIQHTIDYTDQKIKKNRFKNIIYTILVVVMVSVSIFFGYKLYLLNQYTYKKPNNVEKIVRGLKNQKEIKVYKRTIPEEEYLVIENFKIRNDFQDYRLTDSVGEEMSFRTYVYKKETDGKTRSFSLSIGDDTFQLDKSFVSDDIVFFGPEDSNLNPDAFQSADRKFFLLKNDINNEVDFYQYIAENYYKENNLFMDKRTLMENYAFNLFVSVTVPEVESMTILKGDYNGYIFKLGTKNGNTVYQVTILREGASYGFLTNDERFQDDDYLADLLGTIEIR